MADTKGLVREREPVRTRSRRGEAPQGRRTWTEQDEGPRGQQTADDQQAPGRPRAGRRGRSSMMGEVRDLNRGGAFVAVESVAIAMDVFSRVLRGVVDRAFDDEYSQPGDVVRNLTREADMAVYDLVDEMRQVPRRLEHKFEDGIRSPRAERGERAKRRDDE